MAMWESKRNFREIVPSTHLRQLLGFNLRQKTTNKRRVIKRRVIKIKINSVRAMEHVSRKMFDGQVKKYRRQEKRGYLGDGKGESAVINFSLYSFRDF